MKTHTLYTSTQENYRESTLIAPTELVRLRFQQSGLILFCSSARALASTVNTRRSSLRIFFHRSPRRTLMALRMHTWCRLRQLVRNWIRQTLSELLWMASVQHGRWLAGKPGGSTALQLCFIERFLTKILAFVAAFVLGPCWPISTKTSLF